MAWAATWISLSLASHSLSYLSLLLFSLRFSLFRLFRLVLPFWTAGFFLYLHRLLTRLGGCGSSVNETKGAQVFFFLGKFYLLIFFFFLGPREARAPLGPHLGPSLTFIQILYQQIFFFQPKYSKYSGMMPFKALIFFKKGTYENRKNHSQFTKPWGPTTVHTGPWFFFHRAVLEVKTTSKMRGL